MIERAFMDSQFMLWFQVLTDNAEEQSVTKLILDGLLVSTLDISTWEGATYGLVANALRHNNSFTTLKISGVPSKQPFLKDLVPCLAGMFRPLCLSSAK